MEVSQNVLTSNLMFLRTKIRVQSALQAPESCSIVPTFILPTLGVQVFAYIEMCACNPRVPVKTCQSD